MFQIQLNRFFNFCRVKVVNKAFEQEKQLVTITLHPDEHYDPVCSHCQQKVKCIHSYHERTVRDLKFPNSLISFFLSVLKRKFS